MTICNPDSDTQWPVLSHARPSGWIGEPHSRTGLRSGVRADCGELDSVRRNRRNEKRLGCAPYHRRFRARADGEWCSENLPDVRVDAKAIGSERRGKASIPDHVRVAAHGAGDVSRALAVNRIRVPDAADVDPVSDRGDHLALRHPITRAHDHVRAGGSGRRIKTACGAFAQPVAAAWRKRERAFRMRPEFLGAMFVGEQAMAVVEIREQADETAAANKFAGRGRNSLACDSPANRTNPCQW